MLLCLGIGFAIWGGFKFLYAESKADYALVFTILVCAFVLVGLGELVEIFGRIFPI
jgi:hypothetical protein